VIRLVRVELTRLRWRRAVLLLVGAAVLVPLVILGVRLYDTRPVSDADRAEAQVQADQDLAYQRDQIAQCKNDPRQFGVRRAADPDQACERRISYPVDADDYLYRPSLSVSGERGTSGLAVVAIIGVLMLLVGTTYVGHDWGSGSMSNQLLFETRRLRVWAAKAVAVALLALAVGAVGLGLFWGGVIGVASARDLDVSGQTVTDVVQQAGRGLALIVGGAFGGYALTTLFRSTVFTIGILFGVSVAGGVLFGALLPGTALRYEPTTNALAVVNGQTTWYVDPPPECFSDYGAEGVDCMDQARLTQKGGAVYYVVLLGVLGVASAASYRRRDVP
jgi:ABC-2 type transport system permease protein